MATHGEAVGLPEIAIASLYQDNLVTRHTGRAVRLSIEGLVSELGSRSLTILDFGDVSVIDFSCADEVVAKLVLRAVEVVAEGDQRYYVFRGVQQHHLDPMESALRRRGLVAAAQGPSGEPFLIGDVEPAEAHVWLAVCGAGTVRLEDVAPAVGMEPQDCGRLLDHLCDRRLLHRDGLTYQSLFDTFAAAERAGARRPFPDADGEPSIAET